MRERGRRKERIEEGGREGKHEFHAITDFSPHSRSCLWPLQGAHHWPQLRQYVWYGEATAAALYSLSWSGTIAAN